MAVSPRSSLFLSYSPRTTATNYHKCGGWHNRSVFSYSSESQAYEIMPWQGQAHFQVSRGNSSSSSSFRLLLTFLGLWQHHSSLCLHFHMVPDLLLMCLSVSPPLIRMPGIGFSPSCPKSWIISPWDLWLMASANILFSSTFIFWGSTWTWTLGRILFNPLHLSISVPYSKSLCSNLPFWLSSYCMTFFSAKGCHSLWHKQRLAEVQGYFLLLLPSALLWGPCAWLSRDLEKQGAAHLIWSW